MSTAGIDDRKVVVFKIGNEEYATNIGQVERILEFQKITKIPDAPDYLKGVTNCLGRIVPVIDLKKRFGLSDTNVSEGSKIIIAKQDQGDIGLIVDTVSEVIDISDEMMTPPPEIIVGIVKKYIKGLINMDTRIIINLNLGRILSFGEREAIEEMIN
ncbi:chemotaxis protein CheW [Oxobacter pfennigii]|uniref:Chemotaxis protein CheW n=1 Tax=Oxobacter pfennigii TaxID=36849 RepID=A0A0P8X1F4_9CLOT|nr:chemotaxis protein CheW [Oxobacter pfennigii]KPU44649.1 chemotaxis protein CheW [Oxobacter pfennigii]